MLFDADAVSVEMLVGDLFSEAQIPVQGLLPIEVSRDQLLQSREFGRTENLPSCRPEIRIFRSHFPHEEIRSAK